MQHLKYGNYVGFTSIQTAC